MARELQKIARVQRHSCSIYKIPDWITELDKNAYKPRVVSFGPYHHDDPVLRPMEVYKERVLHRFLKSSGKSMEECVEKLSEIAQDLMDAYDSLEPRWKDDPAEFLKLMLRDGVFMVEVLQYWFKGRDGDKYEKNDPIFNRDGSLYMPNIMRDMLMLENQLPLKLILTDFLCAEDDHQDNQMPENQFPLKLILADSLGAEDDQDNQEFRNECAITLIIQFCRFITKRDYHSDRAFGLSERQLRKLEESNHVLDVYRKLLILGVWNGKKDPPRKYSILRPKTVDDILPISASKLHEAGIIIQKSKTSSVSDGIWFYPGFLDVGGVLILPELRIDHFTVFAFLNLMAFERLHVMVGNEVTSYLAFMDDIIKTEKDVEILEDVIFNRYGTDEAVAKWFNTLPRDIGFNVSYQYLSAAHDVNSFYDRWWNKWRRHIMHTYFSDPWTPILRFGGIIFFCLTVIQTVFTVAQYFQGKGEKITALP